MALLALGLAIVAVACASHEDVPPLERRAQQLSEAIMCPVCPGESIDQSRNPLAVQMRGIVVDRLERGWTEDEVKGFFVERYGPSVILEPPTSGFSLLAWVLPPAVLVGAGVILYLALRLMRKRPAVSSLRPEDAIDLSDQERDEYFKHIEDALR